VTSWIMTRKTVTVVALTFLVGFSACTGNSTGQKMLMKAKEAHEKRDFIASVQILNKITPKTAEVIYWHWKNEKEIGSLADGRSRDKPAPPKMSQEQTRPHHVFYSSNHWSQLFFAKSLCQLPYLKYAHNSSMPSHECHILPY